MAIMNSFKCVIEIIVKCFEYVRLTDAGFITPSSIYHSELASNQ